MTGRLLEASASPTTSLPTFESLRLPNLQLAYLVMVLLAVGRAEAPEGLARPGPKAESRKPKAEPRPSIAAAAARTLASPNNSVLPGLRESSFARALQSRESPP